MNFMFGTNVMSEPDLERALDSQTEEEDSYYYEMDEIEEVGRDSFEYSPSPGIQRAK